MCSHVCSRSLVRKHLVENMKGGREMWIWHGHLGCWCSSLKMYLIYKYLYIRYFSVCYTTSIFKCTACLDKNTKHVSLLYMEHFPIWCLHLVSCQRFYVLLFSAFWDQSTNPPRHQASDHQCGKPHPVQLLVQPRCVQTSSQHHQKSTAWVSHLTYWIMHIHRRFLVFTLLLHKVRKYSYTLMCILTWIIFITKPQKSDPRTHLFPQLLL